jgi:hypothetical protein
MPQKLEFLYNLIVQKVWQEPPTKSRFVQNNIDFGVYEKFEICRVSITNGNMYAIGASIGENIKSWLNRKELQ